MTQVVCRGCGVQLSIPDGEETFTCPSCGKVYHLSVEEREKMHDRQKSIRDESSRNSGKKKKWLRTLIGVVAVAALTAILIVLGVKLVREWLPEQRYQSAIDRMEHGDFESALKTFDDMRTYKESREYIRKITESTAYQSELKVGSRILLGSYEQDGSEENGTEPIQWRVLAIEDDRILVISEYALECQPYNYAYADVTWAESYIRSWLNDEFPETAFTDAEWEEVLTTHIVTEDNEYTGTEGGENTDDKVFLLSIEEAREYFSSDEDRDCIPTVYAQGKGANVNGVGSWWWLRSPGIYAHTAAFVGFGGTADAYGDGVLNGLGAVRPAMWIRRSTEE